MSARIDAERAADRQEARIEVGKERLRLAQRVLTAYVEGLGLRETADLLGRSRHTVWKIRVWLGVQSGRQHAAGRQAGRIANRRSIEGVQP